MVRSPSSRPPRAETPRPAPVVRDFRGAGASYAIEWDVRTVYDFLISLSDDAGGSDDLPAADRRWVADARAGLPEPIRADRQALLGNELCIQIAEFAAEQPSIVEPAAFVQAVAELEPTDPLRYGLADLYQD